MYGSIIMFVGALILILPITAWAQNGNTTAPPATGPRSELSLAIEEITGIVVAIGGIIAVVLEWRGRKGEAAEVKRYTDLFGQKTIENLPRIELLYDLAKTSGQIPIEYQGQIEAKSKEVKEAAKVGREQLQVVHEALKPNEKAAALVIPRESMDTSPIADPKKPQPTIQPKKV